MGTGGVLHKSRKRIYQQGTTYFVTTVTHNRSPFFQDLHFAELFVRDLSFAQSLKLFDLYGYAVLPNHAHLLLAPLGQSNISDIAGTIKRNVSRDINCLIKGRPFIRNITNPFHLAADDSNRRLRGNFGITREDHPHINFETYTRHFSALEDIRQRFMATKVPNQSSPQFKWQKSFHDHIIRDARDYDNHVAYIYNNAAKHHLVEDPADWPWMWVEGMDEPLLLSRDRVNPSSIPE